MKYRVVLKPRAEKELDKLSSRDRQRIIVELFELSKNPYTGKKLEGKFRDCYSLRIGMYRIIYKVYKTKLNILIIRIGPRQRAYK